jgi:hypothetical protein
MARPEEALNQEAVLEKSIEFARSTKQRNDQLSAWLGGNSEQIWLRQRGAIPMRKSPNNSEALVTFIARKTEIDTILARLSALSSDHFNRTPKEVTWGDVGSLGSYLDGLRQVSDAAFREGEHAG